MNNVPEFTKETHIKIFNNHHGDHIEIRPDSDGLQSIEINVYNDELKRESQIYLLNKEQAQLFIEGIKTVINNNDLN